MVNRWKCALVILLLSGVFAVACEALESTPVGEEAPQQANEGIKRETVLGPVRAEVQFYPENPVLGERVTLMVTVDVPAQVSVMMPEFGDQLGRFGIADFKETQDISPSGRMVYRQRYTLDLPMSGRLRLPGFLIEFVDNRPDSELSGKVQELLTEELSIEVVSVLPEGQVLTSLYGPQGPLPELVLPQTNRGLTWWVWAIGGMCLGLMVGGMIWMRRRRAAEIVLPPDVVALSALGFLRSQPMPTSPEAIDAWYVSLSGIIRTYVEARFSLHAPRLTTEEFFELAGRSDALSSEEKAMIHNLLASADRVKFTEYVPATEASLQILEGACQFVEATRVKPVEAEG